MTVTARLFPLFVVALVACGGDASTAAPEEDTGELIVRASGSAVASSAAPSSLAAAVSASTLEVGFVEMRVSANTDCSGPYQTVFTRGAPNRVNVIGNPEIARTNALMTGTYPCVLLRISDFLRYVPAATEGVCMGGVTVEHDFFREGNEPVAWRDPALVELTARGTRVAPVEDLVWIYLSRSETAVEARGYAENQVLPLSSSLVVPGVTTFYWDLTNGLAEDNGRCEVVDGMIGFR